MRNCQQDCCLHIGGIWWHLVASTDVAALLHLLVLAQLFRNRMLLLLLLLLSQLLTSPEQLMLLIKLQHIDLHTERHCQMLHQFLCQA
jgi:hypothetical protein